MTLARRTYGLLENTFIGIRSGDKIPKHIRIIEFIVINYFTFVNINLEIVFKKIIKFNHLKQVIF